MRWLQAKDVVQGDQLLIDDIVYSVLSLKTYDKTVTFVLDGFEIKLPKSWEVHNLLIPEGEIGTRLMRSLRDEER